jgi:hypothetical protein
MLTMVSDILLILFWLENGPLGAFKIQNMIHPAWPKKKD